MEWELNTSVLLHRIVLHIYYLFKIKEKEVYYMFNLEELVFDSLNHFVNDLGYNPTIGDIIEDLQNNYVKFDMLTPEEETELRADIVGVLGRNDMLQLIADDEE